MESIIQFLDALNKVTPIGIIALLGLAIFFIVWKNPFKPVESAVSEIKDNHLHDVVDRLDKISDTLIRMELKMSEDFAHLKAKLTNGHK